MQLNSSQNKKDQDMVTRVSLLSQHIADDLKAPQPEITTIGLEVVEDVAAREAIIFQESNNPQLRAEKTKAFPAATAELARLDQATFQDEIAATNYYLGPISQPSPDFIKPNFSPDQISIHIQSQVKNVSNQELPITEPAENLPVSRITPDYQVPASSEAADIAKMEAKITPTIQVIKENLNPLDLLLPLTIDTLPERQNILRFEVDQLHQLMLENPGSEELWKFIERCTDFPGNAVILRHNLLRSPELITSDLLDSILFLGPVREKVRDLTTGQQRDIIIYGGSQIDSGGSGEVSEVLYVYEDDLSLRSGLIKLSIPGLSANQIKVTEAIMAYEQKMSAEIDAIVEKTKAELNSGKTLNSSGEQAQFDPTENILRPTVLGESFIIMPKIKNAQGQSLPLFQLSLQRTPVEQMAKSLLGAARGLAYLTENNIIAADNSDRNILDSEHGGVIIDLGGFISQKMLTSGQLTIATVVDPANPNDPNPKSAVGIVVSAHESASFESREFMTSHIFAQELLGQITAGTSHKISLARIIERYLTCLGYSNVAEFSEFTNSDYRQKLNFPPFQIDPTKFTNPKHQTLYNLYKTLLASYQHQTRFIGNSQASGLDHDYISMEEVQDILQALIKP